MTVKDLSELHYLDALITRQQERLQELRDAADVKAQVITGMPNAKGAHDRIGEIVPKLADAQAELEAEIEGYREKLERLRAYINRIENPRIKIILILRFVDRKPWMDVAEEIGGGETEYSVKQACYRYLESRKDRVSEGQTSMFE